MTSCQECARPWGVILDRGEKPTDEGLALARAELIEELRDQWACDEDDDTFARIDWSALPKVEAVEVVYLTEALFTFAEARAIGDGYGEEGWYDTRYTDLPGWLLKGRRTRWAYRWDCCDIGFASNYVPVSGRG